MQFPVSPWDGSSSQVSETCCGTDTRGPSSRSGEGGVSALKPRPVIEFWVDSCQTAGDADWRPPRTWKLSISRAMVRLVALVSIRPDRLPTCRLQELGGEGNE